MQSTVYRKGKKGMALQQSKRREFSPQYSYPLAVNINDFKSYLNCHTQYNETFFHGSGNHTLIEILVNLPNRAIWFRYSYLFVQEFYEYAIKAHRKLFDYFIKKDVDSMEDLVKNIC